MTRHKTDSIYADIFDHLVVSAISYDSDHKHRDAWERLTVLRSRWWSIEEELVNSVADDVNL